MKHSILDGTPADTFPSAGPPPSAGRARVRDCMSHPGIAVTPGTDLATVAAVLGASRRGVVPVVSPDGSVTGVVSASDLLTAYAERDPRRELLARDLMSTPAVTVTEDTGVIEAVALVAEHGLHHLPVVDADGLSQRTSTRSPERGTTAVQPSSRSIRSRSASEPSGSPWTR
ncbi:CBS domain-containing protein [Kitasatospora sp. NPDC004799]|uniref:CBS domain-containing protein n=1 Tax=Kitasatospora sp. NPDC004799 TaxID=3154460 RepID=UPI0033B9B28D